MMNIKNEIIDNIEIDACIFIGVEIYFNHKFAKTHAEWLITQRKRNKMRGEVSWINIIFTFNIKF